MSRNQNRGSTTVTLPTDEPTSQTDPHAPTVHPSIDAERDARVVTGGTEPSTTEPSTTEPSTTEPSTTEPSTTEPTVTLPDGRTVPESDVADVDPTDTFRMAVELAIVGSDVATGTVSAVDLDTVKRAYRALSAAERKSVASVIPTRMVGAMSDPKGPDMQVVGACAYLTAAVAEATAQPAPSKKVALVVSPVDQISAAIERATARTILAHAALAAQIATDLSLITDPADRHDAGLFVHALTTGAWPIDAAWLPEGVALKGKRSSSSSTPRAPRDPNAVKRDVAAAVGAWLADHGSSAKFGTIAKALDMSGGAVANAVRDGRVAGWTLGTVDGSQGAVPAV